MGSVFITDYIDNPDIERSVLGEHLGQELGEHTLVLLVWHERIDGAFLDKAPNLKGVVRYGVGIDNVDIEACRRRGIIFCNTPDYGTDEVSDTALCMILNILRGVTRYDHLCRGFGPSWQENVIGSLRRSSRQVLGVLGAGRIGGLVALKAKALNIPVLIYDPYRDSGYEKLLGVGRVTTLDELLDQADIITIHTPLTPETEGMVDETFIAAMRPGASLVNTARGRIVRDLDLFYEPLRSGALSCLGLDVLPTEPPVPGRLIKAWRARAPWLDGRVIINPHTSYFSQEAAEEMRSKTARNALRILKGQPPLNRIV
ncbi:MAG: C-terminal binding protein [Desulfovibrio sp.]|nr:C-terminal binding protein [Desulfovibrio sp.]